MRSDRWRQWVTFPHAERTKVPVLRRATSSTPRFAAIALAVMVSACSLLPPPSPAAAPFVPDMAGVVQQRALVGQNLVFKLEGGREFTFLANADYLGGSAPTEGDLLVSGVRGERWVYRVMLRQPDATLVPSGCYAIFGRARQDSTNLLQTVRDPDGDMIMVFPKTADWGDEGFVGGTDELAGIVTCINEQGQAFKRTY
jgi:hypothetical protein